MKNPPILIKTISQKDNHTFTIAWSNGTSSDHRLHSLQKKCPCAKCYDPATGQQHPTEMPLDTDVRATKITSVGRYAIRIQFTSGCSRGIYSFATLQSQE